MKPYRNSLAGGIFVLCAVGLGATAALTANNSVPLMTSPHVPPVVPAGKASRRASNVAQEIGRIRDEWVRELHAKQLDQIMTFYAPDAVFLPPNSARVTGQPAIRVLFKSVMETFTSNLTLHSIVIESSGDLAYDSGEFQETLVPTAGGPNQDLQGSYVTILKRQPDGQWRIVQHVWTMVGPEVPPTAK